MMALVATLCVMALAQDMRLATGDPFGDTFRICCKYSTEHHVYPSPSMSKRIAETKATTKTVEKPKSTQAPMPAGAKPARKAGGVRLAQQPVRNVGAGKLSRPTKPSKTLLFEAPSHGDDSHTVGKHSIPKLERPKKMDSINGPAHKAMSELNKPRNMRVNDAQAGGGQSAAKVLAKALDPKELLSPDAQRYAALLDAPFEAEWGDAGERQVKPLLYADITPPATTQTIRCYGQKTVSIAAGQKMVVGFAVGNANQVDPYPNVSVDVRGVAPLVMTSAGVAAKGCAFLGMPNCGNGNFNGANLGSGQGGTAAGGQGCAGYTYKEGVLTDNALATSSLAVMNEADLLHWGSAPPLGDMDIGDATSFKYRPVAGGLMITPAAAVDDLGGTINISVIPQANNFDWARASGNTHGVSNSLADFYGLPDHKIVRGDKMVTVNWLPGRQDYDFLVPYGAPSDGAGTFSPVNFQNTEAGECRVFAEIIPADTAAATTNYVLTYIGFYEVSGYSVNATGTVPRPQPSLGAKVATAVQDNLFIENENRSRQVQDTSALEVAKDHPKLGPMIEDCKTAKEAKSWFSEILDLGKEIVPLAAMLL